MRVLITRPEAQATATRKKLEREGHQVDAAPMMTIRFLPLPDFQAGVWRGLIFTSMNGVKAAENTAIDRRLPAYCVGEATAEAAKSAGFSDVRTAAGNADSLYELIQNALPEKDISLLHLAGRHRAGNLAERLAEDGYPVDRITAYEAEPVPDLPPEATERIGKGMYEAVLFYSPRTAKIFVERVAAAGLTPHIKQISAVCLSEAVEKQASRLVWRRIVLAKSPAEGHLLQALKELAPLP